MLAKLINDQIAKYPYSAQDLYADHPGIYFPDLTPATLAPFGVVVVVATGQPEHDRITQSVIEATPVYSAERGRWEQAWQVVDASADEIARRQAERAEQVRQQRQAAYEQEADPLYFQWQRGEATQQEWLDKIADIKRRYS